MKERICERLLDRPLPSDIDAERKAICAVIVGPMEHATKLVQRAKGEHFYDPFHGWVWDRCRWQLTREKREVDAGTLLNRRLSHNPGLELFRCINSGFWWHGLYYLERVLKEARKRERIMRAVTELQKAIEQ